MTNLDSIFKSRDITLPTKVHLVKAVVFPVVMYPFSNFLDKTQPSEHMWNIAISSGICVFVHAKTLSHPNPLSFLCFFGGSDGKESACIAGDPGSIPGKGRSPGEGPDYPLQHSSLENSIDRGAWWATVLRVSES